MNDSPVRLLLTFLICICFQACATLHKSPPQRVDTSTSAEAAVLLKKVLQPHDGLSTFKGTGTIRMSSGTSFPSLRYAFAGTTTPPRLRMSILDMTGRPIESFSFDGKYVYLLSHNGSHPFVRRKARGKTLEKVLSIPVSARDITLLFCGAIPVEPHDAAYLTTPSRFDRGIALTSKNRIVQEIYIDGQKAVRTTDIYRKDEKPLYSIYFEDYRPFSRYTLPSKIIISGNTGGRCVLTIDRYVPNAPVSQQIFAITPK